METARWSCSPGVLAFVRSRLGIHCRYAGEHNGVTVRKLREKGQAAAHGLHGLAKRRKQKIAALLEARDTVLGDAESLRNADLGEPARVPEFPQGHFLGNQLSRARLNLLAAGGAQFLSDPFKIRHGHYFP